MERKCRSALSSRQAYKQSTPSKTSIAEEKFLMKKKSLSYEEIMSVGNNEDFQIQIGPQKPIGTITSLISNCKMYSGEEIFVCRDEGNEQQMNVEEEKLQYKLDELFIARYLCSLNGKLFIARILFVNDVPYYLPWGILRKILLVYDCDNLKRRVVENTWYWC